MSNWSRSRILLEVDADAARKFLERTGHQDVPEDRLELTRQLMDYINATARQVVNCCFRECTASRKTRQKAAHCCRCAITGWTRPRQRMMGLSFVKHVFTRSVTDW